VAVDDPDDLYGLPLDAFVPERDALAKRLRADGRREEAGEVKALRKPSVAAWAVNQAVRTQPKAARELWDAGDALIGAQEDLLAGRGDARALRAAVDRERSALGELAGAARGLLTSEGRDLGDTTIERVRETLHAAAIDPAAREDVAPGRVTRELAHAGLGGIEAAMPAAPATPATPATPARGRADEAEGADATKPAKGTGRAGGAKAGGAKAGRAKAGGAKAGRAARPADDKAAARRAREAQQARDAEAARAEQERAAQAARREEERAAAAQAERERREAARRRADAERAHREARRALDKAERAADRAEERLSEAQAAADEARAALDAANERERAASAELDAARAAESGRD
jgi:hypothetical protein